MPDAEKSLLSRGHWKSCAGQFTGPDNGKTNAAAHYNKHVVEQREWNDEAEFTLPNYVKYACDTINGDSALEFYDCDGDNIVKYDDEKNNLGIVTTSGGHIRTFFRPSRGLSYVEDRVARGTWISYLQYDRGLCNLAPLIENEDTEVLRVLNQLQERLTEAEVAALIETQEILSQPYANQLRYVVDLCQLTITLKTVADILQRQRFDSVFDQMAQVAQECCAYWEGVVSGFEEVLGIKLMRAVFDAATILRTGLLEVVRRFLGYHDNPIVEKQEEDSFWEEREQLEYILTFLCGFILRKYRFHEDFGEYWEEFLTIKCEVAGIDGLVKTMGCPALPKCSGFHPLRWAWWLSDGHE